MYVDEAAAVAEFKIRMTTKSLVLKRGEFSRSSGQWKDEDYDVLENGAVVGRITREAAMAAFAKSGVAPSDTSPSCEPDLRPRGRNRREDEAAN